MCSIVWPRVNVHSPKKYEMKLMIRQRYGYWYLSMWFWWSIMIVIYFVNSGHQSSIWVWLHLRPSSQIIFLFSWLRGMIALSQIFQSEQINFSKINFHETIVRNSFAKSLRDTVTHKNVRNSYKFSKCQSTALLTATLNRNFFLNQRIFPKK